MKFLYDFFPIVLFFAAYKMYGIYVATLVAIIATLLQVSITWLRQRRIENIQLMTLAMVIVLGGATLLLQDEIYIKWKPTVVDWLIAGVFIGSHWVGQQPLLQRMLGSQVTLTRPQVWQQLNIAWAGFFILMGLANLYVAFNFSTDTWVNFKLFGTLGLTLVFVLAQGMYMANYIVEDSIVTEEP